MKSVDQLALSGMSTPWESHSPALESMNLQQDCAFGFSLIRLFGALRRAHGGRELTRVTADAMEVCQDCAHPTCPGIGQMVSDALIQCGGPFRSTEIPPVFVWPPDLAPFQVVAPSHAIHIEAPVVVDHSAADVVP